MKKYNKKLIIETINKIVFKDKIKYYLNQIKFNQYKPITKEIFNDLKEEGWIEQLNSFYKTEIISTDIIFTQLNLLENDKNGLISFNNDIVDFFNYFDIIIKKKQKYPYKVLDMIDYNNGIVYIFKYNNTTKKTLTLYHGTTENNAKNLLNNGWQPNSNSQGSNMGNSKYLYLTSLPEDALWFADENGGNVVMKIKNIPLSYLQPDPDDESGYTMEELLDRMNRTELPSKFILTKALSKNYFSINN
jgi:hypothetical protein